MMADSRYQVTKRVVDVVVATVLLVMSLPILAICLFAVWVDCGRPLIYRRRVVGLNNSEFDAYKVRTMVPDADDILRRDDELREKFEQVNKLLGDPRITRSGRWLRRFSLDELPQLVNVLRGQMSLVGPRMITPVELSHWGDLADLRVSVKPGITGLWQVSGRQTMSKDQRVLLDAEYVRQLSLKLDVLILVKTIPAMLSGKGAY